MHDPLIQTRLPKDIHDKIKQKAFKDGLSVAAWLNKLVLAEIGSYQVAAWMVPRDTPLSTFLSTRKDYRTFILERAENGVENGFWLLDPTTNEPFPLSRILAERDQHRWWTNPEEYHVVFVTLDRLWRIVFTLEDQTTGRMIVKLAPCEES